MPRHPQLDQRMMQRVQAKMAKNLPQQRPMREVPPVDNRDIHTYYWQGPGAEIPRHEGGWAPVDDQLFLIPGQEDAPTSAEAPVSLWVMENCPPHNCPPVRSDPFEYDLEVCVPTYEQWYTVGVVDVPPMHMAVIENLSYDFTAGLAQYELFEYQILQNGTPLATIEDMFIDPTTGDPSHKYVFSGDTQPQAFSGFVDREKKLIVRVRVRGLVDLAGNSNHLPGDILFPNAHFRITVQGYLAPFRHNVDGAPRHQDLGNMGFYDLDDLPYGEDELAWEGR